MEDKLFKTRRALIKAGVISGATMTGLGAPIALSAKGQTRGIQGYVAPELEIPYWIDGKGEQQKPFTITANKGKWIYLKCFQHWCPGCHSSGFLINIAVPSEGLVMKSQECLYIFKS